MSTIVQTTATAPSAKRAPNRAWRKLKANKGALVGLGIILFFTVLAILAPILPIPNPLATSWSAVRQAPSAAHWLGTDDIGRDILSRMIWGAQASLMAGIFSVAIAVAIGVPFGLISGYYGGWIDQIISRITEAFLAMPFLITAIALSAFLGPSLKNAMIAIGLSATPVFVRLTRGQVLAVKTEDYVEGARSIGLRHFSIITRYILPNVFAPILVQATLTIATAIIAEASLSFLGIGQQAPAPSWGSMLNTAKGYLETQPWMAIWPGAAIFLVVIGFNLLGDGLRDALDPREA
ncbi:ABC transporter permease [Rhizobium sp. NPDC090279]|uniref:ABC transporter permease n=1 Tax=Rhizobium sp. NPDC090279 TaxID=3364499 RepID=UPI00383A3251